ncbi:histidine phosphatase family protein [Clostridium sp. MCC353]|uniref:histidine phosphatase family protein n=1 Tax=Clostridium sp. MCC353 TaxID=2592646 RepID=UPI001C032B49|nr:histidine phosphatase family protein [Clostridium sp. MCC353]MBT9776579.1 histidine phosphatase family protein [Clostridium sp. MCC353]
MKIYLIRHGRQCSKLCNVNVDLAEEGYRQAALLGERLVKANPQVVYSSDLLRAVQTAEAANLYWNVEHLIRPELREISFGDMEGMADEDIEIKYADFKLRQDRMEEDLPYPGGECGADVVKRILPVLYEITQSGYDRAAVVTHGGVIRSLTSYLIGLDLAKMRMLGNGLENCSITELEYHPGKKRFNLQRFNDYAHLENYPELLRSSWVEKEN